MIFRVLILFFISGAGHLLTIFSLKYVANKAGLSEIANIGETEVLFQFIINVVGFGLQTDAIRRITKSDNWQAEIDSVQKSRITLSILFCMFGFLGILSPLYWIFLLTPVFGLSCDYALYARGLAIEGAVFAFLRAAAPMAAISIAAFYESAWINEIYIVSNFVAFAASNFLISKILDVKWWWQPGIASLSAYIKSFPIGVINLYFYFSGLGILFIANFLFDESAIGLSFLALKFYLVFKGALRIVGQAFVQNMNDRTVCLNVDRMAIMLGLGLLGSFLIFPDSVISLLFGGQFIGHQTFFIILGTAALVFSFLFSIPTRVLVFENKEMKLMTFAIASIVCSVLTLVLLAINSESPEAILTSILVGELTFAVLLAAKFISFTDLMDRTVFVLVSLPMFLIPVGIRVWYSDHWIGYGLGFALLGLGWFFQHSSKLTIDVRNVLS